MAILGFNLQKGELHFCLMDGTRADANGRRRYGGGPWLRQLRCDGRHHGHRQRPAARGHPHLCDLSRAAAAGDATACHRALELEAALAVPSSFDEGPDLVLYFKHMMVLKGHAEYALQFNETDVLSESQRGYVEAKLELFNAWYADWTRAEGLDQVSKAAA